MATSDLRNVTTTGKFHVIGELVVSSRSSQQVLYTSLRYLLDAAGGKNVILCSSLPRYTAASCGNDAGHVANRSRPGFESNLLNELKGVAANRKDFLFTSGYKLIKVLDPTVSWRGKGKEELWGDDPVHPTEEAYKLMAQGVVFINTSMESGAKKQARTNSIETGSGPGPALNRQQSGRGGGRHRGGGGKPGNYGPRRGN
jgi:hypothetical protein